MQTDDPIPTNLKDHLDYIKSLHGDQDHGATTEDVAITSNKNDHTATELTHYSTDPYRGKFI